MFQRQKVFVTVLLFLSITLLYGQVKIHKNLNIEEGLVYSQVIMIQEYQQCYMWYGTSSAIFRWYGFSFKNYILPKGLSDNISDASTFHQLKINSSVIKMQLIK